MFHMQYLTCEIYIIKLIQRKKYCKSALYMCNYYFRWDQQWSVIHTFYKWTVLLRSKEILCRILGPWQQFQLLAFILMGSGLLLLQQKGWTFYSAPEAGCCARKKVFIKDNGKLVRGRGGGRGEEKYSFPVLSRIFV